MFGFVRSIPPPSCSRLSRASVLAASVAAVALASGPARAGILDPAPAYPARFSDTALMYDWTGLYVGLNAGGSFGRVRWKSYFDNTSGDVSVSSGVAGGTIGYNAQNLGSFVFGTEFDFDWRGINATVPPPSCAPNCEFKSDWVATARLRFGRAFGGFLPYLTGGLSIGDVTMDIVGQPFGTNNSVSFNWTGGAGVEFVINGPLTGKIEYLYVNHTSTACNVECGGFGNVNMGLTENVFRAGLNYRLWGR
jgi:outer membrane immunogenic protein